jgi:hypothetical protein
MPCIHCINSLIYGAFNLWVLGSFSIGRTNSRYDGNCSGGRLAQILGTEKARHSLGSFQWKLAVSIHALNILSVCTMLRGGHPFGRFI